MFLTYVFLRLKLFLEDTKGASAIEYAIVATMVAVILMTFISPIGAQVKVSFNSILTALGGKAI